mmetsp:Transcript_43118/g.111759  ORF Transcript_43118/g.111759 Transcript_43118/m.111759 type:complete len:259 (-) Transcript_43118:2106-2882(-)
MFPPICSKTGPNRSFSGRRPQKIRPRSFSSPPRRRELFRPQGKDTEQVGLPTRKRGERDTSPPTGERRRGEQWKERKKERQRERKRTGETGKKGTSIVEFQALVSGQWLRARFPQVYGPRVGLSSSICRSGASPQQELPTKTRVRAGSRSPFRLFHSPLFRSLFFPVVFVQTSSVQTFLSLSLSPSFPPLHFRSFFHIRVRFPSLFCRRLPSLIHVSQPPPIRRPETARNHRRGPAQWCGGTPSHPGPPTLRGPRALQ